MSYTKRCPFLINGLQKFLFTRVCTYCLMLNFYCEIKLSVFRVVFDTWGGRVASWQMLPAGQVVHAISPVCEYSFAAHATALAAFPSGHRYPAGHDQHAADPLSLTCVAAHDAQAVLADDPELGLALPAAHGVRLLVPPAQLNKREKKVR